MALIECPEAAPITGNPAMAATIEGRCRGGRPYSGRSFLNYDNILGVIA